MAAPRDIKSKSTPARLDTAVAREAADFFAHSTGLNCALLDAVGELIYEKGPEETACAACASASL